ncbi:PP0621 family protein [Sulfuricurvum sp.]|uniref:PP0621 family protein n=1 Tax=Sulfuricurvum sp. TaxID=2025608 RepID=UPI0026273730|nr:PP0621 family protein [Sulfuricurvum sp.]MDD2780616.1 PP0621 family protein [Sulfuricurvum sp.]
MLKILLLIGVVVGVYFLFFKKKNLKPPSSDNSQEEAMIPCAKCSTYVSAKESLMRDGKYYCCHECLEA